MYLSAVISDNFFGPQDNKTFPTQSKLPSYYTPLTVNPVSVYLWNKSDELNEVHVSIQKHMY